MDPAILIFDTPRDAAVACGDKTLELLDQARRERGIATLAVSGGSTPRLMFQSMVGRAFDWKGIQIFQVDERCVAPDRPESNFKMLREALLDCISIGEDQIHRVEGEFPPDEAVRRYVGTIERVMGTQPVFDVIQRGMGADAHTASLFPGDPLINEGTGIAAAVDAARAGMKDSMRYRVTLTRRVLESARHTLILATGAEKKDALKKVLHDPFDPLHLPCQIASADTAWYVDKAANA
jgi:6-phosphogluconolactonase